MARIILSLGPHDSFLLPNDTHLPAVLKALRGAMPCRDSRWNKDVNAIELDPYDRVKGDEMEITVTVVGKDARVVWGGERARTEPPPRPALLPRQVPALPAPRKQRGLFD